MTKFTLPKLDFHQFLLNLKGEYSRKRFLIVKLDRIPIIAKCSQPEII